MFSQDDYRIETFERYRPHIRSNVMFNPHIPDANLQPHTHNFYEINYLYRGKCTNILMGKSYPMKPHEIFIMRPGTVHQVKDDEDVLLYNILIKPDYFEERFSDIFTDILPPEKFHPTDQENRQSYTYPYIFYSSLNVDTLIEQMYAEITHHYNDCRLMLEALIIQFLVTLNRSESPKILPEQINNASLSLIHEILQYIQNDFSTVSLTVLAENFGYSKEHLSRLIYKNTGSHFTEILLGIKLNYAVDYIKNTSMSIEQIVRLSGFGSIEYFYRQFKKRFGISPNAFRKQYRNTGD